LASYGVDWNGPVTYEDTSNVNIPQTFCPLADEGVAILQNYINTLESCEDHGITLFLPTVNVTSALTSS
jgi:hypothetical protein